MMKFLKPLLMDEAGDDKGAGASGYEPDKEKEDASQKEESGVTKSEDGKTYDEFGYEVKSEENKDKETKKDEKSDGVKDEKDSDEKESDEESSTGYEKDDEVPSKREEDGEQEEKSDDEKVQVSFEGLSESATELLKKKFEAKKQSPEIQQAIIEHEKEMEAAAAKATKEREAETARLKVERKNAWRKELREDKDFGGENFNKNLKMADKVLVEFFEEVKNELTKRDDIASPLFMRGFARVAEKLYGNEGTLVKGNSPEPPKEEKDPIEEMYG